MKFKVAICGFFEATPEMALVSGGNSVALPSSSLYSILMNYVPDILFTFLGKFDLRISSSSSSITESLKFLVTVESDGA